MYLFFIKTDYIFSHVFKERWRTAHAMLRDLIFAVDAALQKQNYPGVQPPDSRAFLRTFHLSNDRCQEVWLSRASADSCARAKLVE